VSAEPAEPAKPAARVADGEERQPPKSRTAAEEVRQG